MVEHLTVQSFKDKVFDYENNKEWSYSGTQPAIIDFYADWCGPCKMVAPIIEELAKEYEGKVTFYKIIPNKNKNYRLFSEFAVYLRCFFIPTNGQPQMAQGAIPKKSFKDAIKRRIWSTIINTNFSTTQIQIVVEKFIFNN
jgi:thiol-disulfide isomerase/thioredoxin